MVARGERRARPVTAGPAAAMVRLHVKRGDESQFLLDAAAEAPLDELTRLAAAIYNGRLKVQRLCAGTAALCPARPAPSSGSTRFPGAQARSVFSACGPPGRPRRLAAGEQRQAQLLFPFCQLSRLRGAL